MSDLAAPAPTRVQVEHAGGAERDDIVALADHDEHRLQHNADMLADWTVDDVAHFAACTGRFAAASDEFSSDTVDGTIDTRSTA